MLLAAALLGVLACNDSSGTWSPDGGVLDVDGGELGDELLGDEPFESTLAFSPRRFRDVGVEHWARPFVDAMSSRGVVAGYPDGSFGPERRLTRAELAAMLSAAFDLRDAPTAPERSGPMPFTDVATHWAEEAIGDAWRSGAMAGYPDRRFRPQALVTRVEVIAALDAWLVARGAYADAPPPEALEAFLDAGAVPGWATGAVARAVSARIPASGGPRQRLRPTDPATRAETVAMIYQTLRAQTPLVPLLSSGLQGVCRDDGECAAGELCEPFGAAAFCTPAILTAPSALAVLMYHDIVATDADAVAPDDVSVARFRAQMQWLVSHGYVALSSHEALRYLLTGRTPYSGSRLVFITFDDGYIGNYERAWPVLRDLGLRASYFVHTDYVGTGGALGVRRKMSWEQLAEVEASGVVEVHSHTQTHPRLAELDEARIGQELHEAARALFSRGRPEPRLIAYPFGSHDARVRALARGYHRAGFRVASAPAATGGDVMAIPRIGIGRAVDVASFAGLLARPPQR